MANHAERLGCLNSVSDVLTTPHTRTMNPLITALLAAGSVAGVYTATVELYRASHAQLVTAEAQRDYDTERLARLSWQLDYRPGTPTVEQLIAAGYLPADYLERKRVGEPLPLPSEMPTESQQ